MKYILVVGGVCSGIGKGIVTSSLGALLKARNLKVTAIKIDPYLNIDAGTFSPYEHGEVFVLNDGAEVDLDLGNYERFLDTDLCHTNNITTGRINQQVTDRERLGDYLGSTVQIVPHFTNAVQEWIEKAATMQEADVCLIELGGTVGDIEVAPFLYALRQLKRKVKPNNFCCCLVSLILTIGKEQKSKPTQHSVITLDGMGPSPDLIFCRSATTITESIRSKISSLCDVDRERVFDLPDLKTIYRVPIELQRQGVPTALSDCLQLVFDKACELEQWIEISEIAVESKDEISIGLVGKYTRSVDCYTSVVKALEDACYHFGARPKLVYIESTQLEENDNKAWNDLRSSNCLIVPGGFGIRGTKGKIMAIEWARKNKLPFLGICMGFQMAVIEFARNVLGIKTASSTEFDDELKEENTHYEPVIIEMLDYVDPQRKLGGTMRLGLKRTVFVRADSILRLLYGNKDSIDERHRHRYEVNQDYIDKLEKGGLKFVGRNEDGTRMEILELDESEHPYFVAVQYHPEYKTRPFRPSPPYLGLIDAARTRKMSMSN